jgi:Holliday junction resolvase
LFGMSYRRGRRFEYIVRDLFRSRGWFVVRAAASRPVDLVCLRRADVGVVAVLVECKYGVGSPRRSDAAGLVAAARRAGATPVLAFAEKRGRMRMIDAEKWLDFTP